jgi:DNA-binding transcriptional ArsR family regulator
MGLLLTHDLCVGALARRVGVSEATISQHLQTLRKAGLVRGEKRGYWTHYVVQRDALRQVAQMLTRVADKPTCEEGVCSRTLLPTIDPLERGGSKMCQDCCQRPEKLKGKAEDCTPEQIKECHGDVQTHLCQGDKPAIVERSSTANDPPDRG